MLEFWKKGCLEKSTPGLNLSGSISEPSVGDRVGRPPLFAVYAGETGPAAGLNTDFLPLDGDECAQQLAKSVAGGACWEMVEILHVDSVDMSRNHCNTHGNNPIERIPC